MTDPHVPPSRRRSTRVPLADVAYDALLLQIIGGKRAPGDWLNIGALSRELELSATPVREALARLEPTGLVRRDPLRGYDVAPLLTAEEITQLMDARLLFEPLFTAQATERASAAFLADLAASIETMEHAGTTADAEAFRESWVADEAFHTLISAQTGNPFTHRAFVALGSQLQRFRLSGRAGRSHAREAAHEHREIYAAIAAGDGEAAAALMRSHLGEARRRTLDDERAVTNGTGPALPSEE